MFRQFSQGLVKKRLDTRAAWKLGPANGRIRLASQDGSVKFKQKRVKTFHSSY